MKAHELEQGILQRSNENVRKILGSVAASAGMEAEIVFTGKNTPELEAREQVLQLEAVTD